MMVGENNFLLDTLNTARRLWNIEWYLSEESFEEGGQGCAYCRCPSRARNLGWRTAGLVTPVWPHAAALWATPRYSCGWQGVWDQDTILVRNMKYTVLTNPSQSASLQVYRTMVKWLINERNRQHFAVFLEIVVKYFPAKFTPTQESSHWWKESLLRTVEHTKSEQTADVKDWGHL